MPGNRKPRKKHKPMLWSHTEEVLFGYSKKTLEELKSMYRAVEMIAYDRLPAGQATEDDMMCLKRLVNHVQVSVVSRGDVDMSCRNDVVETLNDGAEAIVDLFNRFPKTQSFVCKGDELKHIVDAVAMSGPYIEESIASCPRQFVREFEAMKRLEKTVTKDAWIESYNPNYIKRFVREMA